MATSYSTKMKRAKRSGFKVKPGANGYKIQPAGTTNERTAANQTTSNRNVASSDHDSFAAAQQAVDNFLSNQPKTFWQGFWQGFRQA